MLGTLRLVLAAIVALSHIGGNIGEFWIGVWAVTIFYIISGYAMTGLLTKRFSEGNVACSFYFERIVRLAPQYYFWLILSVVYALVLKWYPYQLEMKTFWPYEFFAYFTVMPLGLQRYLSNVDALILPQATTLGIELTLYIFSPWILKNIKLSWFSAIVSLGLFWATAISILPSNIYTYYTSPGPVVFYIMGSFLYRKKWISLGLLTIILTAILGQSLWKHFEMEFLFGVILGLPLIACLIRFKPNKIDSAFGDASYGCFLGHGIVFYTLTHFFGEIDNTPYRIIATLFACVAGWLAFYLVEKPTVVFRRQIKSAKVIEL